MKAVTIATDGGCSPNPGLGAYAAILGTEVDGEWIEREICAAVPDTTNNRMELMAVVVALETLKVPCTVTLISDSQYILNGRDRLVGWVEQGKLSKKANADLWQRFWTQRERHEITYEKVQSHHGESDLNHRADKLVRRTREAYCAQQAQTDYRVLIAGSREATDAQLQVAARMVARCQELGWQIVVGDNPEGVDQAVVQACRDLHYHNVIVVSIAAQARNGGVHGGRYEQQGRSYTERDQLMAKAAHRGVFLRNIHSTGQGTLRGYRFMKSLGKQAHLIDFS